ncbi:MAG: hypothetical protein ACI8WM_003256 [Burkholderiaceae bacterium]|jgi:hypothetical protein
MKLKSIATKIVLFVMISTLSGLLYREYLRLPPGINEPHLVSNPAKELINTTKRLLTTEKVMGPTAMYGSPRSGIDEASQPQGF